MANQTALKTNYNFVKGLATEASLLAAPEGFCSAMSNVVLGQDGSLSSRAGLVEHTADFALGQAQDGALFVCAEARGIEGGLPDTRTLAVYAGGLAVMLFDVTDLNAISLVSEEVVFSATPTHVGICASKGYFIITSDVQRPVKLSYDGVEEVFIHERDFEGVDDGLQMNARPSTLETDHLYNLRNQGWPPGWINVLRYPSNADIPWLGMYTHPMNGYETFSPNQLLAISFGTTPAPKGSILLDAFDTTVPGAVIADVNFLSMAFNGVSTFTFTLSGDYTLVYSAGDSIDIQGTAFSYTDSDPKTVHSTTNGAHTIQTISFDSDTRVTTLTVTHAVADYQADFVVGSVGLINDGTALLSHPNPEVETRHPVATAAWAGRVWYGTTTPAVRETLRGALFFSQVVTTVDKFGMCYQDADPTARQNNELVATDGGRITITDMGTAYQLLPFGSSLVVFADNGVWAVVGRDGIFDPTNYAAVRVSDRGVTSGSSAIVADGMAVYYSNGSLYAIQGNELGTLSAKPMADHLSSYFDDLVDRDDSKVRLAYDKHNKTIRVVFAKDVSVTQDVDELVLDLRLGAFYPLELTGYAEDDGSYGGIIGAWCPATHYTSDISTLYIALKNAADNAKSLCFLTMSDTDAVTDTWSGESFESYASTYPTPMDAGMIDKQMPRVGVYMGRKTDSGLKVQGRFAWSNSGNSGKWGTKQEAYFDRGASFDVCWKTLSIRGSGKAVQLHFTNDSLKPFKLLGWDIKYTGAPE